MDSQQAVLAALHAEPVREICRRHRIRRLALFGSALRADFGPESDIDLLAEFETGVRVGLDFFTIERELGGAIGRKVDLNTPGFLGRDFARSDRARGRGRL